MPVRVDSFRGCLIAYIAEPAGLTARPFRAATHDLDIARIAEQTVAFLGGQLLDDAKLLQVTERLGGDGEAELQVGLDSPRMEGRLEPAEFHRTPVPDVVQVAPVVAAAVVVLGLAVVIAVPDTVELGRGVLPKIFHLSVDLFSDYIWSFKGGWI